MRWRRWIYDKSLILLIVFCASQSVNASSVVWKQRWQQQQSKLAQTQQREVQALQATTIPEWKKKLTLEDINAKHLQQRNQLQQYGQHIYEQWVDRENRRVDTILKIRARRDNAIRETRMQQDVKLANARNMAGTPYQTKNLLDEIKNQTDQRIIFIRTRAAEEEKQLMELLKVTGLR
jgi:hypothetical protein